MPPWKYEEGNISHCETKTFTTCRSIQNCQILHGAVGSCKNSCKYVAKKDKNNFFTVSAGSDEHLIRRGNFLHNTKGVISDQVQQKERERSFKHLQSCIISINEIHHHVYKYQEVFTKNLCLLECKQHHLNRCGWGI